MTADLNELPGFIAPNFWDTDFAALSWQNHRDFIIRRLLSSGDWQAVTWLRGQLGDEALREWIIGQRGAGLSPRQLRFWEMALELPHRKITSWIYHGRVTNWQRKVV